MIKSTRGTQAKAGNRTTMYLDISLFTIRYSLSKYPLDYLQSMAVFIGISIEYPEVVK
jgi:hypothetical protein